MTHQHHDKADAAGGCHRMSANDLADLGLDQLAYIRPAIVDGEAVFSIHSASGERLGIATGRETAQAAVRQHEMEPFSVH